MPSPRGLVQTDGMSESIIALVDAGKQLLEIVERVPSSGEPVILIKSGERVVRIVPIVTPDNGTAGLIAFLQNWRARVPEPDEQFSAAAHESRAAIRPPDVPRE